MLEELEHAQARGAPILAEFLGGSCTCDAHHMTEPQPQGRGVRLCIEKCAPVLAAKWARIRFEGQVGACCGSLALALRGNIVTL